jgi:hypothetical protein
VQSHRNVIALITITMYSGLRSLMLAPQPPPDAPPAPSTCIFVTNPLFHVSGLHTAAITCLATGTRSVWNVGRYDPAVAMATIARRGDQLGR